MAENEVKPTLKRTNVLLDSETERKADKLAEVERRSFNNLVRVLIDREFERQGLTLPQPTAHAE